MRRTIVGRMIVRRMIVVTSASGTLARKGRTLITENALGLVLPDVASFDRARAAARPVCPR